MLEETSYEVIVVGGGPAGAVAGWALATRGVKVAILERATFPREKVCGDFVEPGGLRILDRMGCLTSLETKSPLPITHVAGYVNNEEVYQSEIPYYDEQYGLPPYGYIIPRIQFDAELLQCATAAGAKVFEACAVKNITRKDGLNLVTASQNKQEVKFSAPLIVGADGVESIVARSAGIVRQDPQYISLSQRGYVEGVNLTQGEAMMWFDADIFPGYGWMFPMANGRANIGIGILSEACQRHGLSVPRLFDSFVEKLRRYYPACEEIKLERRPNGGIVKSYGAIDRNSFDGGLLVGDAGCFADPMTAEGISPGMESSIIATNTIVEALEAGRFDARAMSRYEKDYRDYFDPAMRSLDFYAAVVRNRYFRDFYLSMTKQGWQEAVDDPNFAEVAGTIFGGLDLRPAAVMGQFASKIATYLTKGSVAVMQDMMAGRIRHSRKYWDDLGLWQKGMRMSMVKDPKWHMAWVSDVASKASKLKMTADNPRVKGPVLAEY
jgi:geranylgeranyl reductase family protein